MTKDQDIAGPPARLRAGSAEDAAACENEEGIPDVLLQWRPA
jgi:hypothetical protein